MARLSLQLLGQFQVWLDGTLLTGFESDKTRALLAYLAVESARPHRREALAGLLWPDVLESAARQSLSQALSNLRRVLRDADNDPPFILASREAVQFNPLSGYTLDVDVLVSIGVSDSVDALNTHPFLDGFTLSDADGFDEWLLLQREAIQRRLLDILDGLAQRQMAAGRYEQAIRAAQRQLELDPRREEAHAQLMHAFALNGQRSDALAQYEKVRKVLAEALGIEPTAQTKALHEQIKRGDLSANAHATLTPQPAATTRPASVPQPSHRNVHLPQSLTAFVGRTRELAELDGLLADPQARLITLVGLGGMGKTRLAVEAASRVKECFVDGVVFVPLTAVTKSEAITLAIATTLKLTLNNHSAPDAQVMSYLREKHMLLVLDNVEDALTNDPTGTYRVFDNLLTQVASAKLLVTSREALQMPGEWLYPLDGMCQDEGPDADDEALNDAIALFVQGARHARASFQLRPEGEADVRRICRLVAGMPLGIELAASWVRMLDLSEIASEIESGVGVLTTTMRNVPERHRSMTAVLDHSWNMLSPEEQGTVEAMSVFRGGFTREMARTIAGVSLAGLAQLVSKSIVRRVENGRYDLHELMRQYAHARLADSGRAAEVHRKHTLAFLAMAEVAVPRMYGPEAEPLRAQFQPEASNFRAAFEWACDGERNPHLVLRLATALGRYWYLAPDWREGYQSVQRALALVGYAADRLLWAKAQMYLGVFEHTWGNYDPALRHFEAALTGFRDAQDQWHEAWTLTQIFQCHFAEGRLDAAEVTLREGLQQMQALGDRWAASYARWQLGYLARARGDYATATQLAEEALIAFRELDDRGCQILASNLYGDVALYQGDYDQAAQHYTNSMNLGRSMNNLVAVAWSAHNLGQTALAQGRPTLALTAFGEAYLLRDAIGDHEAGYEALQGMAVASAMLDRFEQAAQFFGAAARSQHGDVFRMAGPVFALWEAALARTRAALGEAGWATAQRAGQAMPVAALMGAAPEPSGAIAPNGSFAG